jgi:magnesium-protoporphyrin O-methyltransferase
MSCTSRCSAVEQNFDGRVAAHQLEQYRRKGASRSTRQLLRAIQDAGIAGSTVIDVGGGVGAIAMELLDAGAARAIIVEASAAYLHVAHEETSRRQLGDRVDFLHGDFVALAHEVSVADVVTLDKVVCCYPDMKPLLERSTDRASRLYGIVYPRDAWWVRLMTAAENFLRRMKRSAFRVYVFDNTAIDVAIRSAGFHRLQEERGLVWITAVYQRSTAKK